MNDTLLSRRLEQAARKLSNPGNIPSRKVSFEDDPFLSAARLLQEAIEMKALFAILLQLVAMPLPTFAHSGRTDLRGSFFIRKTGGCHGHGGSAAQT